MKTLKIMNYYNHVNGNTYLWTLYLKHVGISFIFVN